MEVGSPGDRTRDDTALRLPTGPPPDRAPAPSLTPSVVTHRPRSGYAGLVPPLRSSPGSLPTINTAARPSPSFPLTGPSLPEPEPGASDPPIPELASTAEPVSLDAYGLPTEPADDLTPSPSWTSRQRSTARRRAAIALALVLGAGVVAAVWLAARAYLPSDERTATTPSTPVAPSPVGPEASATAPRLRPSVASLRDELQRARDESRFTTGPVRSYAFELADPFQFEATVTTDVATGDLQAIVSPNIELRRVEGRDYGRTGSRPWIELSAEAASAIPPMLLAGPLEADDVLPPSLAELVIEERPVPGGVEYVLDDVRLPTDRSAVRDDWLGRWGIDPRDSAELDGHATRIVVEIVLHEDGTVRSASISSASIGGRISYELLKTAGDPYVVAQPQLAAG